MVTHDQCSRTEEIAELKEHKKQQEAFTVQVQRHMEQQTLLMQRIVEHTEKLVHIREDLNKEAAQRARETDLLFKRIRNLEESQREYDRTASAAVEALALARGVSEKVSNLENKPGKIALQWAERLFWVIATALVTVHLKG